ncbi:MAG: penicillin acylase family protein, partial [Ilumatobacteraceae bacterium]
LAGWDGRFDTTSVGAGLWREFIATFSNADLMDAGPLWKEPFDDRDPLGTPSGLSDDPGLSDRLTAAARALRSAGFDIDTPLGEMQRADRNGVLVPIHGGFGSEGVSNVVSSGANGTTSEAGLPRGDRLDGTALRTDGYPVSYGTSFIYDVEFTAAGPVAEALLTYGETGDPTSEYFADQTVMFSNKQWRPIRFTVADIESDPALRAYAVGE